MIEMKKKSKFGIVFLTLFLTFSFVTPIAISDTTIGNSTIPVNEGSFYEWTCTYASSTLTGILEEGSWYNLTIESIGQGSYYVLTHALVINATLGMFVKGLNIHTNSYYAYFLVYNASLSSVYYAWEPLIVPDPTDLVLIKVFIEVDRGTPCYIVGNSMTVDLGSGSIMKYRYGASDFGVNGILSSFQLIVNDTKQWEYRLTSSPGEGQISFGNYYLVITFICISIIALYTKKRFKISNR